MELQPTWTPRYAKPAFQAAAMRELRSYADEGFAGWHMLGERMLALAFHPSLSYADMARAARMEVAEVRRIVAERWEHDRYCKARAAEDRIRRHMMA